MKLLWIILVATTVIEHCDMSMFPALFRVFEEQLPGASPTSLGNVLMVQGVTCCLSLPFWGYWVDRRDRLATLIITQATLALMMFSSAYVTSVTALLPLSAGRAICVSSFTIICQGLVATRIPGLNRGWAIGAIIFAGSIGRIIGMVFAGGMSHAEVLGYPGWRVLIFVFGAATLLCSMVVAALCHMCPTLAEVGQSVGHGTIKQTSFFDDLKYLVTVKSYVLVVLQGVFASAVAATGNYTTMMFQYMRFSDVQSAALSGILCLGFGLGAMGGGAASDALEKRYPNRGRVALGIFAAVVVLIMTIVFVFCTNFTELDQRSFGMTAICIFTFAIFKAIPYAGTVKPILIDVVPRRLAGTCNACAGAIDGTIAAFLGAPMLGMLAERAFGYTSTQDTIKDMPAEIRKHNMLALVRAFCTIVLTFTLFGFLIFSLLIHTYPQDKIIDDDESADESAHLVEREKGTSKSFVSTRSSKSKREILIDAHL